MAVRPRDLFALAILVWIPAPRVAHASTAGSSDAIAAPADSTTASDSASDSPAASTGGPEGRGSSRAPRAVTRLGSDCWYVAADRLWFRPRAAAPDSARADRVATDCRRVAERREAAGGKGASARAARAALLRVGRSSSFPSGHTSIYFETETILSHHARSRWVAVPLYALAVTGATQRVQARAHWPSDVFIPAVTGTLIARTVVRRTEERDARWVTQMGIEGGTMRIAVAHRF